MGTSVPSVGDAASPTFSICIQDNRFASASVGDNRRDLNISTEAGNGERIGNNFATLHRLHGNRVNTRSINRQRVTCAESGLSVPFILIISVSRNYVSCKSSRGERAIAVLAKYVDTADCNILRKIFNLHRDGSGNAVGNTSVHAKRSGSESMDTRSLHCDRDGIQVVTRDLNIIHIPLICMSTHSSGIRHIHAGEGTYASGILCSSKNRFHCDSRQNHNLEGVGA